MSREATSPWSDWLLIPGFPAGLIWNNASNAGLATSYGTFAIDALDRSVDADYKDGATRKLTFARQTAGDFYQYHVQLPIPNYVIARQQGRLSDWSGVVDEEMDYSAGRRIALHVRNILASRDDADVIGADITRFLMSAKFRGYGGDDGTTDDLHLAAHQDGPITGDTVATTVGNSVFGDMEIPGNGLGTADTGLNPSPPTFDPDGVCRIDTLIEVPDTVAPGDVVELLARIVLPATGAGAAGIAVQWYGAYYRWIMQPYPFFPNRSIQLLGQDDADSDDRQQLEAQSRDDDLPSNP